MGHLLLESPGCWRVESPGCWRVEIPGCWRVESPGCWRFPVFCWFLDQLLLPAPDQGLLGCSMAVRRWCLHYFPGTFCKL